MLPRSPHVRQPQRLVHSLHEILHSTADIDDAALLHQPEYVTVRTRHAAEEHADVLLHIALHNLSEDLNTRPVDGGDALDVEDDIAVVLR